MESVHTCDSAEPCPLAAPVVLDPTMSDKTAWEEYCEASLDLSDQDDVGEDMKRLAEDGYPEELGDFVVS